MRSVALLEARAKVNDIKISFQREELKRYILTTYLLVYFPWVYIGEKDPDKEQQAFVKTEIELLKFR